MPSFGGEVKVSVPCPSFAACKRTEQLTWVTGLLAKFHLQFLPSLAEVAARRWCAAPLEMTEGTPLGVKSTISHRL
jgi:hypothetical protein